MENYMPLNSSQSIKNVQKKAQGRKQFEKILKNEPFVYKAPPLPASVLPFQNQDLPISEQSMISKIQDRSNSKITEPEPSIQDQLAPEKPDMIPNMEGVRTPLSGNGHILLAYHP